jgi:DNA primase
MAIDSLFLDLLRERTAMRDLVGRSVDLEGAGRVFKGRCPFHEDGGGPPSLYAYDHGFHCFGCGAHGDAIDFVARTRSITTREAIAILASAAGLGVPDAEG